ncbi:hypothetical protein E4U38_004204 [Claviceps purpurea]|nr:hypothetical protein E4U12_006867 [Claviceps purpurea]KAG6130975.1 hypothetical protein E4U38_004204 [Claviceps purpurea]KAG6150936.1 hypothetical protein E4U11_008093 [Claviceps purpurea]KAG6194417.1 hypothetical protein E4U50_000627 [Claviceps purpurea]KAG6278622.1 hypothetical protein E4U48_000490 [Claviceps purpurea]
MPTTRKQRLAAHNNVPLRQPDRTGPSEATLLEIADQRGLFQQAAKRERELSATKSGKSTPDGGDDSESDTASNSDSDSDSDGNSKRNSNRAKNSKSNSDNDEPLISPRAERILDAALWTVTIAMVHFTLDVLVHNQYAREMEWSAMAVRTCRAWGVFLFLFYFLHPFTPNAPLVPGLPSRLQHPLRQALFFATSVVAGCSLIHVTNTYGYLATMKQAPPLGCLWLWAVVELDLVWGCVSLLVAAGFLRLGGYDLK